MTISNKELVIKFDALEKTFSILTGIIRKDQMRFNILKRSLDTVLKDVKSLKENQVSMMKILEVQGEKLDTLLKR